MYTARSCVVEHVPQTPLCVTVNPAETALVASGNDLREYVAQAVSEYFNAHTGVLEPLKNIWGGVVLQPETLYGSQVKSKGFSATYEVF
jgi:hypothetical protein